MKYVAVYEQDGTGWKAYVPDLPGCTAHAATREELERKISELIALTVEALQSEGQEVPDGGAVVSEIESLK